MDFFERFFQNPTIKLQKLENFKNRSKSEKLTILNQMLPLNDKIVKKVRFLTFSQCSSPKKGSKNHGSVGSSTEVFDDFGHF